MVEFRISFFFRDCSVKIVVSILELPLGQIDIPTVEVVVSVVRIALNGLVKAVEGREKFALVVQGQSQVLVVKR